MIIKRNQKHKKLIADQKATKKEYKRKPSGSKEEQKLYHSVRWRKLRLLILQKNPLCVECKKKGLLKYARVVDHIEPARVTEKNFYDIDNLQALCDKCHNSKSRKERKLYKK